MPFRPLVTTGIESLPNISLYRSSALKTVRSRLLGKVLRVEVKGFSTSLILALSERQADVLNERADDADCTTIAYASVLSKLRDRQQPAAPIRSGELEVQGGIQVMQNFVTLAGPAGFDPTELPTPYAGGITAEGIGKALRGGIKFLYHSTKCQQCYVAEVTTEEWRMTLDPLEVVWFMEETAAVERVADALTKRLEKLEAK